MKKISGKWVMEDGDVVHCTIKHGDCTREIPVKVKFDGDRLEIMPKGYGEFDAADGEGAPVFLEGWENRLAVVVSADINDQGKERIDLEKAQENLREQE